LHAETLRKEEEEFEWDDVRAGVKGAVVV